MKKISSLIVLLFCFSLVHAQQPFNWVSSPESTGNDAAFSLTLDKNGNVYHAGQFDYTTDFDPGIGVANLISVGSDDAYFAKYDSNGNYLWAKSIGGVDHDVISKIVVDDTGNIYVTGTFRASIDLDPGVGTANFTSNGGDDFFFAKYDPDGNYLWGKTVGSIGSEQSKLLSVSKDGSIYLCGQFGNPMDFDPGQDSAILTTTGSTLLYIAKYDNNGNYLWVRSSGSPSGDIYVNGMAMDTSANLYITGSFAGSVDIDPDTSIHMLTASAGMDIFYAKYDSSGNLIWGNSIAGSANLHNDEGTDIVVNDLGELFIFGIFSFTVDFDPGVGTAYLTENHYRDMFIAHYDSTGAYIYAKALKGPGIQYASHLTVDGYNNVYITGWFADTVDFDPDGGVYNLVSVAGQEDIFLAKYNSSGQLNYAYRFGDDGSDTGFGIALDKFHNVYFTGRIYDTVDLDPGTGIALLVSASGHRIFAAKYGDSALATGMLPVVIADDINIYPNPATKFVNIQTKNKIEVVYVRDITGKLLLTSKEHHIYISSYPTGIYFIHVQTDKGVYTKMICKE